MRIMLGSGGMATLLVEKDQDCPEGFYFTVINGGWHGKYVNGEVFVSLSRSGIPVTNVEIISDDQAKLAGEYNEVFDRFL